MSLKKTDIDFDKITLSIDKMPDAESLAFESEYPIAVQQLPSELKSIYTDLHTVIKVFSMMIICNNDDYITDFKYFQKAILALKKHNLVDESFDCTEDDFLRDSVKKWVDLMLLIFAVLTVMPGHGGIESDEIKNTDGKNLAGIYNITITLKPFEPGKHRIGLFVPEDIDTGKVLILFDNDVVLTT